MEVVPRLFDWRTFGPNLIKSVLLGNHYVRSVKGMFRLCEVIGRLQLCEFFSQNNGQFINTLQTVKDLQAIFRPETAEAARQITHQFVTDTTLIRNSEQSETFAYWNRFVQMVNLLKDLIRADREGNWPLHLKSLQSLLPLFAVCDRTNYLRWCSVYLEDMMKLESTAPHVYEQFMAGKFVVKQSPGTFKSVGADMCLEQTINRSQKSSAGIIVSTKQ